MNKWETNSANEELAKTINNNKKFEDGDTLKASDLNNIVGATLKQVSDMETYKKMYQFLAENFFSEMMDFDGGSIWNKNSVTTNYLSLTWNTGANKLYAKVNVDTDLINYIHEEYGSTISVYFEETQDLKDTSGTATTNYNYEIEFYLDEDMTQLVFTYKGTIKYYYESNTSSGD